MQYLRGRLPADILEIIRQYVEYKGVPVRSTELARVRGIYLRGEINNLMRYFDGCYRIYDMRSLSIVFTYSNDQYMIHVSDTEIVPVDELHAWQTTQHNRIVCNRTYVIDSKHQLTLIPTEIYYSPSLAAFVAKCATYAEDNTAGEPIFVGGARWSPVDPGPIIEKCECSTISQYSTVQLQRNYAVIVDTDRSFEMITRDGETLLGGACWPLNDDEVLFNRHGTTFYKRYDMPVVPTDLSLGDGDYAYGDRIARQQQNQEITIEQIVWQNN